MLSRFRKIHAAPLVTLVLLLASYALAQQQQPDREHMHAYYRQVREAINAIPMRIGEWEGQEVEVPTAAVALLRPNVLMSRQYINYTTGRSVTFLLLHCYDARDMLGHYPPVCYINQGWQMEDQQRAEWRAAEDEVSGMTYDFTLSFSGNRVDKHVANLLILPDGRFAHGMSEVRRSAANRRLRFYGAAQMQLVFHGNEPAEERRQTMELFTSAAATAIDQIRTGAER